MWMSTSNLEVPKGKLGCFLKDRMGKILYMSKREMEKKSRKERREERVRETDRQRDRERETEIETRGRVLTIT